MPEEKPASQPDWSLLRIPLDKILLIENVRGQSTEDEILALMESLKMAGQKTPCEVRPCRQAEKAAHPDKEYTLLAGYGRYQALSHLGEKSMLCLVKEVPAGMDVPEMMLSNAVRGQSWLDDGIGIERWFKEADSLSQTQVSATLGLPLPRVSELRRIMAFLDEPSQALLLTICKSNPSRLPTRDAVLALSRLEDKDHRLDPAMKLAIIQKVLDEELPAKVCRALVQWVMDGKSYEKFQIAKFNKADGAEIPPMGEGSQMSPPPTGQGWPEAKRPAGGPIPEAARPEGEDSGGGQTAKPSKAKSRLSSKFPKLAQAFEHKAFKFTLRFAKLVMKAFIHFCKNWVHRYAKLFANAILPVHHSGSGRGSGSGLFRRLGNALIYMVLVTLFSLAVLSALASLFPALRPWVLLGLAFLKAFLFFHFPLWCVGQVLTHLTLYVIASLALLGAIHRAFRPKLTEMIGLAVLLAVGWYFRGMWPGLRSLGEGGVKGLPLATSPLPPLNNVSSSAPQTPLPSPSRLGEGRGAYNAENARSLNGGRGEANAANPRPTTPPRLAPAQRGPISGPVPNTARGLEKATHNPKASPESSWQLQAAETAFNQVPGGPAPDLVGRWQNGGDTWAFNADGTFSAMLAGNLSSGRYKAFSIPGQSQLLLLALKPAPAFKQDFYMLDKGWLNVNDLDASTSETFKKQ